MFTPAIRKSRPVLPKDKNRDHGNSDSPSTPAPDPFSPDSSHAPRRPATGTPAPWTSRLSVLARHPPTKNEERASSTDLIQPIYIGEVPEIVHAAQTDCLPKKLTGIGKSFYGGMDRSTYMAWTICQDQIFIWSYFSPSLSNKCVALQFPSSVLALIDIDMTVSGDYGNPWMVSLIKLKKRSSIGLIICHRKHQVFIYWPDIFTEDGRAPIIWLPQSEEKDSTSDGLLINSMICSSIPNSSYEAVSLVCHSNGRLWCLHCTPMGITQREVLIRSPEIDRKMYAKSLTWRFQVCGLLGEEEMDSSSRQFFFLVNHEIQCWNIMLLSPNHPKVTHLWSHEIVSTDGELGIKKDLAGQKHIWLLDMQIDRDGKEFTLLVAMLCKDQIMGSSYTQYSLLTMQYKAERNISIEDYSSERVLERKVPLEVIIPKARVEDESVLLSMKLCLGGKPYGSVIILSGDGTATVTNHSKGSIKLYKFDLPFDAGKVIDASVFPSSEDGREGAWVVLTEKAGVWAIPETAVLLGSVEPPKRSLSRNESLNGGIIKEDKRNIFGGFKQQHTPLDEEAEVLLGRFFHEFLLSGEVKEGVFEKLKNSGAFEKESETNVFARMSRSIIDTLAKHWTTSRGAEFLGSSAVVSQLLDKKQKYERYLQFLALSKCHEELSLKQRHSLQIIAEHGEKLYSMIQLREFQNQLSQNQLSQNRSTEPESQSSHLFNEPASGPLWDLIQLVGDKSRRHTVLLMDRDNAEVFYSKISELDELFCCVSHHVHYMVGEDHHIVIRMKRAYEISNACVTIVHGALDYRRGHQTWYPSPEGLTSWNCQPVVRTGLWSIANVVMHLLSQASLTHFSAKSSLRSQLELLTDSLLESYMSSITSRIECGDEPKGLIEEYHHKRDVLLCALYQQARDFTEYKYKETCNGHEENPKLKENIFREISCTLLLTAKRHEGYQTLWNICYDLHDAGLLRNLMHESVGSTGGFSYFVFKQFCGRKQFSKLFRLGEEFQEELASYLKQHKDLLWLHDVFLNKFSSVSNTLHALALSVDDVGAGGSISLVEENLEPVFSKRGTTFAERKRLLNLAKISTMAGKVAGFESRIKTIDADLKILKLQEEITKQLHLHNAVEATGDESTPPPTRTLIKTCLKHKSPSLTLLAFDLFICSPSTFHLSNKPLLEQCWRTAADQDDWVSLHQKSQTEGWSDETTQMILTQTLLYKGSYKCYGEGGGGFDNVFAIHMARSDRRFSSSLNCDSVQEILMQHKDFPDAGKLMMTAVLLGKNGLMDGEEGLDLEMEMK